MIALVYYPLAVGVTIVAFISAIWNSFYPTELETKETAKLIGRLALISWAALVLSVPITIFLSVNKL